MELKPEYAKLQSAMLSDSMYTGKVFGFTMQRQIYHATSVIVWMCCLIQVVFLMDCMCIDRQILFDSNIKFYS